MADASAAGAIALPPHTLLRLSSWPLMPIPSPALAPLLPAVSVKAILNSRSDMQLVLVMLLLVAHAEAMELCYWWQRFAWFFLC